eukprot:SAG11_NODE_12611_length_694_cov_2.043697_2_plen_54_part_00
MRVASLAYVYRLLSQPQLIPDLIFFGWTKSVGVIVPVRHFYFLLHSKVKVQLA